MVKEIKVRRIRYSEINEVGLLIRDTIRASYTAVYPERAVEFFLECHPGISIEQRAIDGLVVVAESNGEVIATGSIVDREIIGVFVRQDMQGNGVGSRVMDELEVHAIREGYNRATLSISLTSKDFYEKRGYDIIRSARIDVGEGQFLDYWEGLKKLGKKKHFAVGGNVGTEGGEVIISHALTEEERNELDRLLWEVLWQPLGFPRDVRISFQLKGPFEEYYARSSEQGIIGGIVIRVASPGELDICHIAVCPGLQGSGIGKRLVGCAIEAARRNDCTRIVVIARNTSVDFFKKLGFVVLPRGIPDHPEFKKWGVTFHFMELCLESERCRSGVPGNIIK